MNTKIPRTYSEDQKFVDEVANSCHVIATKLNFSDDAFRCIGAYVASQFDAELTALRTALLRIQTHQGFDANNCAMKSYDTLCECQRWAEEALQRTAPPKTSSDGAHKAALQEASKSLDELKELL